MKIFLQKAIFQIDPKKLLWLKKVISTVPWTHVISYLNGEETVGTLYKKGLQKTNQEFWVEKVIKRKGGNINVKWKGYKNYVNSWIDKKYII